MVPLKLVLCPWVPCVFLFLLYPAKPTWVMIYFRNMHVCCRKHTVCIFKSDVRTLLMSLYTWGEDGLKGYRNPLFATYCLSSPLVKAHITALLMRTHVSLKLLKRRYGKPAHFKWLKKNNHQRVFALFCGKLRGLGFTQAEKKGRNDLGLKEQKQ